MDKALKVLVVALLLLSIAAVVVEFKIYSQRMELKGRTNKLADYVVKIAGTVELPPATITDLAASDNIPRMIVKNDDLKQYYKIGDDGKPSKVTSGSGTMDDVLSTVLNSADRQHTRLNDTRGELTQTRTTLGQTSNQLVSTEGVLATTSNNLVKTIGELAETKQEIEKKKTEIEGLNGQVETQKADIEKKTGEISTLTEKVSACESEIDAGKRYIAKIEKEMKLIMGASSTNALPSGVQGHIAVMNTNWNFVVIDMLPEAGLIPMTDLTVQRNEKLVGKVRVSEIRKEQRVAVAEVLPEYSQLVPAKGDVVFY
jgi:archaellum component FlaC